MSDIVERLRQTRADMLGTPDEAHYWDCVEAATEIEKLRAALKPFAIDFVIDIGEEYDDDDWFDNYNPKDLRAAAAALNDKKNDNK